MKLKAAPAGSVGIFKHTKCLLDGSHSQEPHVGGHAWNRRKERGMTKELALANTRGVMAEAVAAPHAYRTSYFVS